MPAAMLTRAEILAALRSALEPLPYVQAMWEGGAAAFQRVDEWSDIDLQVAADDDRADDVFPVVEEVLARLGPVSLRYEIPQPAWHGHAQVFYQLKNASPFLMIDFVVMRASSQNRFLEPEIHGQAVVHFDKTGFTRVPPLDPAEWSAKLAERVQALRATFDLFQVLVTKELNRGNHLEALAFYNGYCLRPLVEALRIQATPYHYNFFTRYLYYELPAADVQRLERLFFVGSPTELPGKQAEIQAWFADLTRGS